MAELLDRGWNPCRVLGDAAARRRGGPPGRRFRRVSVPLTGVLSPCAPRSAMRPRRVIGPVRSHEVSVVVSTASTAAGWMRPLVSIARDVTLLA